MKKALALALILCLTLTMAVSVFAEDTIKKGTPVLDGMKDDIYNQSISVKGGPSFYNTGDLEGNADSTLYALYDDKYLYICVEVLDNDLTDAGKDYLADPDNANPWESEAVEVWVDEDGSGTNKGKFSMDYLGTRFFWDVNSSPIDPAKGSAKASLISGGYCVEFALELPVALKEGGKVGIALQINDKHADGTVSAMGSQAPADFTYVLGTPVVVAAPVTEAPTTAAEVVTDAPAADVPAVISAPVTADSTVVVAVIALLAVIGAAVVVGKRRVND